MRKKIKVLYLVSTLKRSGPVNQLFYIVSNIDKEMFSPLIVTLSNEPSDSLKQRFLDHDIPVKSLGLSRVNGFLFGFKRLKRIVRDFKPRLIHSQGIRSDRYNMKLSRYVSKSVATIRCIPTEDYSMRYGGIIGKAMAFFHFNYLQKLSRVVSVSYAQNDSLLKYNLNTTTIHNGVDTEKFNKVSLQEKSRLREVLGLPSNKIILISVGHLSTIKDPLTIINAFIKSNIPDVYLLMLGDGELQEQCEVLVYNVKNIDLRGRVTNVKDFLCASDIFVSSSTSEGLPNTVLESLSCDVPTILSNIPQHKEVMSISSSVYPNFNVGDVDGLSRIINSIQNIDLLSSRSSIKEQFDARMTSNKYQEIYLKLLE